MMGGNMGGVARRRNGKLAGGDVKLTKTDDSRGSGISTDPGCRM